MSTHKRVEPGVEHTVDNMDNAGKSRQNKYLCVFVGMLTVTVGNVD